MNPLALLQPAVQKVTITSQLLPDVEIDDPFAQQINSTGAPGGEINAGALLLKLLRPSVTIYTPAGPVNYAPYGESNTTYWPLIWPAALVVGLLALYGGYRLATS